MINSTTQEEPANTVVPARRNKASKSITSSLKKQETRISKTKPENGWETAGPTNSCVGCIEVVDAVTATGKRVARIFSSKRPMMMAPVDKAQQKKVHFIEKMVRAGGERRGLPSVCFFGATVTLTPTTQSSTRKSRRPKIARTTQKLAGQRRPAAHEKKFSQRRTKEGREE